MKAVMILMALLLLYIAVTFIMIHYINVQHELGHAMAAKELGFKTFIVIKTLGKSRKKVLKGITTYCINLVDFYKKYNLRVGAFCAWDGEDNNKIEINIRQKINEAGYKVDRKLYIKLFPLYFLSVLIIGLYAHFGPFEYQINTIDIVIICGFFIIAYIMQIFSNSLDAKKMIKSAIKKASSAKEGTYVKYSISDGAKVHNPEEYQKLLDIVNEKQLKTEDSYIETLNWAEKCVE